MSDDRSRGVSGLFRASSVWLRVVVLGLVLHAEPTPVKSTGFVHGPVVPHGMLRQCNIRSRGRERAPDSVHQDRAAAMPCAGPGRASVMT